MKNPFLSFTINLGLLFTGLLTTFSGLLLQIEFHMSNHGNKVTDKVVNGINYLGWSDIHKFSIIIFSLLTAYHVFMHWKWYSAVIKKRLFARNKQLIILSIFFVFVAVTGFVPWIIDLLKGSNTVRRAFIEIHDKLTILLIVNLILHLIKRMKWFFTTTKKLMDSKIYSFLLSCAIVVQNI